MTNVGRIQLPVNTYLLINNFENSNSSSLSVFIYRNIHIIALKSVCVLGARGIDEIALIYSVSLL